MFIRPFAWLLALRRPTEDCDDLQFSVVVRRQSARNADYALVKSGGRSDQSGVRGVVMCYWNGQATAGPGPRELTGLGGRTRTSGNDPRAHKLHQVESNQVTAVQRSCPISSQ
jgi:hypothetical protein